ncbi:MAG: hypothetical protein P1P76_09215 [Anaerolineales bacterium]|nr:hypothetical protein [Anaerolineales bacterium]
MQIPGVVQWVGHVLRRALLVVILTTLIGGSAITIQNQQAQTRVFTRPIEFNFLDWTLAAAFSKLGQWSLGATNYLSSPGRVGVVERYLTKLDETQALQRQLEDLYGDPDQSEIEGSLATVSGELEIMREQVGKLRPVVETILQEDVGVVLQQLGFSVGGAPFPPVLMQFTPLPSALIVSPRSEIRQDANIALRVDLTLEQKIALEERIESAMDVSALVVPVGGLGTYPTMIQQSTILSWVTEVIAHEWTHNYLSLHPLGLNYSQTPELRTMNETTALLIGVEFSRRVLRASYPGYLPPEETTPPPEPQAEEPAEVVFDFRREMRETRLRVDELLAQGEVEAAEEYMEERRVLFWEHGHRIRKLNQAYFAFHGAYADEPGGAAGDDPVGAAVRALWEEISSPADFLRLMAAMNSHEDLERTLQSVLTTH